MRSTSALPLAVLFLSFPAFPQDPVEILNKVQETYKTVTNYDIEQTERREYQGATNKSEFVNRVRLAGADGKSRHEYSAGSLNIFDGHVNWSYSSYSNEYIKKEMPVNPGRMARRNTGFPEYSYIAMNVKSARLLRQENVTVDGTPFGCWVIEVEREYRQPPNAPPRTSSMTYTYWVDTLRYLVLKRTDQIVNTNPDSSTSTSLSTTTVTKLSIGQPVAAALFEFHPPDGAIQVEEFTPGKRSKQLGSQLPDFSMKDLNGAEISSTSFAGNMLLIAVWRGAPQEDALPFLEMVHRAYRGQNVSVLAVVAPYGPDMTARMVSEIKALNYTIPFVIDTEGTFAKQAGIDSGYGMLLADRSGKIVYSVNGTASNSLRQITRELRKAGAW